MFQRAFNHRCDGIIRVEQCFLSRVDTATIDADSDRTVVVFCRFGDKSNFFLPRFFFFVVIKVSWVVADLVNMGRDDFGQTIVFLQIHRQIGRDLGTNLGQSRRVLLAVDGDSDNIGSRVLHQVHQRDRGIDIGRLGRRHRLDGDRVGLADGNGADLYGSRRVSLNMYHQDARLA